jgi:erythronate-4-phosphate dehydrogenase
MKLVIDENISYAREAFSEFGEVVLLPGRKITNEILKNADVLIVRSITNVNEKLLDKTNIRFVGTATIGKDHVDTDYLISNNIEFADAAGCNADAVAEYILTSLTEAVTYRNSSFKDLKIGVVGVGNIGSRVSRYAEALGMYLIKNDPPLKRKTGDNSFKEIEDALKADIITLHVPLNLDGIDKTYHLVDKNKLSSVKNELTLLNTSRGSVVDNPAIENFILPKNITTVLDVWENEPAINMNLLKNVFIASPHIAGYSLEGKVNGTVMIYSALCKFLNVREKWKPVLPFVDNPVIKIDKITTIEETLRNIFHRVYDIKQDDNNMRKMLGMNMDKASEYFDLLRKNYPLRREFNNYSVSIPGGYGELEKILSVLRFNVNTF